LALLLVVALVGLGPLVADASPPPRPVTPANPPAFATAADDNGVDLGGPFDPEGIPASTATVEFDDDGDAVWTVRHELAPGPAERLRDDPGTLAAIVDDVLAVRNGQGVTDATDVSARMDGDTVVLTVREPAAAANGLGGHLLVDSFHPVGGHVNPTLAVDSLTVVGPAPVAHAPADWAVDGAEATLAGDRAGVPYGYLAFGEGGPPGTARAAVFLALLPVALPDVPLFVLLPTAVFATTLAGLAAAGRRLTRRSGGAAFGGAVAVGLSVGASTAVAVAVLVGITGLAGGSAPFVAAGAGLVAGGGLAVACVVAVAVADRDRPSSRSVVGTVLAALALAGTAATIAVGPVALLVAGALALVFAAGRAGGRRAASWGGGATLLFAAAAFAGSWSTMTTGGSFAVLAALFWCALAVLVALAGLALWLAGRGLDRGDGTRPRANAGAEG
jgi:hypothetical protein